MINQLILLGIISLAAAAIEGPDTYGCTYDSNASENARRLVSEEEFKNACVGPPGSKSLGKNAPESVLKMIPEITTDLPIHIRAYKAAIKSPGKCVFVENDFAKFADWCDEKAAALRKYRTENNFENVAAEIENRCNQIRTLFKSMLSVGFDQESTE